MDRVHRTLLYIGEKPDETLLKSLSNGAWKVMHATSANMLGELPETPMPGLLDLTKGVSNVHIDRVDQLSRFAPVAWVALVSRQSRDLQAVRDAIAKYCFDFVTMPTSHERILNVVSQAVGMEALRFQDDAALANRALTSGMIGSSEVMRALHRAIGKVAATDATVFISGESGTGKELTAQMIHAR